MIFSSNLGFSSKTTRIELGFSLVVVTSNQIIKDLNCCSKQEISCETNNFIKNRR